MYMESKNATDKQVGVGREASWRARSADLE